MSRLLPAVGWLVSNVRTNDHSELFETELASSRMRAGVCIQGLNEAGIPVLPLNFREPWCQPNLVFMAKFVPDSNTGQFLDDGGTRWGIWLEKIKALHARGCPLVVDYTDHHFSNPNVVGDFYRAIESMVSGMVVPSTKMKSHLDGRWSGPLEIIPEPVEVPIQTVRQYTGGKKVALWFGHNSNLPYLFDFMANEMHDAPPDRLIILTNHAAQQVVDAASARGPKHMSISLGKWSVDAMLKAAAQAHYAVIPSNVADERKNGASPGRLLTSLAMGLPVVATPLESYLPFSNYFAPIGSPAATALMANPGEHTDQIEAAQLQIQSQFTVPAIGAQWAAYARRLIGQN